MEERDEEFEQMKNQVALKKSQKLPELPANDTDFMTMVKQEEENLLKTEEVIKLGKRVSEERIKSDVSAEASRIRTKNIETAENEFKNETRELKLKHLKAEMNLQHKYNMETLDKDARHKQLLARRKKLVEKYGYLYNMDENNCVTCYDEEDKPYKVPKDFSYSPFVNRVRQFGRNMSKLDRPVLQTIKWVIIGGLIVGAYFILKKTGII